MAGSSMTFTYEDGQDGLGRPGRIQKVIASWVSDDAAGTASGTSRKLCGRLVKAMNAPGAGGVQPTNGYSIVVTDSDDVNILTPCLPVLTTISNASKTERYFFVKNTDAAPLSTSSAPLVSSALTLSVSGAGNSKQGAITLYIESL